MKKSWNVSVAGHSASPGTQVNRTVDSSGGLRNGEIETLPSPRS